MTLPAQSAYLLGSSTTAARWRSSETDRASNGQPLRGLLAAVARFDPVTIRVDERADLLTNGIGRELLLAPSEGPCDVPG